ncbi:C-type lectin domain family 4 member E-like [Aquarana catesbeiana]|uniref:C-type lectin domain family 4 member E-like n=1 Tax=Aquarana catesbeiana TaxID=8400 RepID=UPI003CC97B17
MSRNEELEMVTGRSYEDNVYGNVCYLDALRMKNAPKAKGAKITHGWLILILVVLFFLFLALLVVTVFLFISHKNMTKELSHLRETDMNMTEELSRLRETASSMTSRLTEMNYTNNSILVNGTVGLICGKDWTFYKLSCYYKSKSRKSWLSAKEKCQRMASHLVIINEDDEMNFLLTLLKKEHPWIGLRRVTPEEWKWVDGTTLNTEKFWEEGEPNSFQEQEDCGHFGFKGGLNDISCSSRYRYICEKSLL